MTIYTSSAAASPITVTGLPAGSYTFQVSGSNSVGTGPLSAVSAAVTVAAATSSGGTGAASFATTAPVGPAGNWRLNFADDFLGSSLNTTNWWPNRETTGAQQQGFNNSGGLAEAEYFDNGQVSVANSNLILTATPSSATVGGVGYTWKSGCVKSLRSGTMQAAPLNTYMEARIFVPQGNGLWPAFWWSSHDGDYGQSGYTYTEVDAFEFFDTSKAGQRRPSSTYHLGTTATQSAEYGSTNVDYTSSWHTYGCQATAGGYYLFIDGVQYPVPSMVGVTTNNLTREILFNLAVIKANATPPSGVQMLVDWFRLWTAA